MLFNSLEFFFFFPVVTLSYFALPHRYRWALLLAASCLFYMAFVPVYIAILGFTIVVDYFAGIWIERAQGARRRAFLLCSLVANIGVLAFFKYFNFVNDNLQALARAMHWHYSLHALAIALPIGLSFHTFQAMSYTIEVYRGKQTAERHFGIYALYVMFYPQLVAGPIERPQNLLHQFREPHRFDYRRVVDGLRLMAWGFFKKIVVADRLAVCVNLVYGDPSKHAGAPLIIATYFFAVQIYCDFSGYSDIALGTAQVMGFRLMKNFDRPYAARTIAEFWRRWHISLSTWFRDYLYTPLRESAARRRSHDGDYRTIPLSGAWDRLLRYRDLSIVFLVSGLWHGANWTFVVWGALHATYLIASLISKEARQRLAATSGLALQPRLQRFLQGVIVFHLVAFAWIFFRAKTLADAWHVVTHALVGVTPATMLGPSVASTLATSRTSLALSAALAVFMFVVEGLASPEQLGAKLDRQPAWARWGVYYALTAAILFLGEFRSNQFIYFQF